MNQTGRQQPALNPSSNALLTVVGLSKSFGGLRVLQDVSCQVNDETITALIGPNGAGKTTLFNILCGVEMPDTGRIRFRGRFIERQPASTIASLKMARTFQTPQVFDQMTALENVMTGLHLEGRTGFFSSGLSLPHSRREETRLSDKAQGLLEFMGLGNKRGAMAGTLSYGDRRLLEVARSLAMDPMLMLLDEPATGLNRSEREALAGKVRSIRDRGVGVFIIEHDMRLVMGLSDEVIVLNYGSVIAHGTPEEVQADPEVVKSYLGRSGG